MAVTQQDFAFVGGAYTPAYPYQDRQICVNWFVEIDKTQGARTPTKGISGQLAVYPTVEISQPAVGQVGLPPVQLIPFNIPDISALAAGPNILEQLYGALSQQAAYAGAVMV